MADQLTSPVRIQFAQALATARKRCRLQHSGARFKQSDMAEALSTRRSEIGLTPACITNQTVSDWEKHRRGIAHDNRSLLTDIISVLAQHGGLHTLDEANNLLLSGCYHRLTTDEIRQANPDWEVEAHYLRTSRNGVGDLNMPSSNLVGLTGQAATLLSQIALQANNKVIVITGLPGSGKSALAQAVLTMYAQADSGASRYWVSAEEDRNAPPDVTYERMLRRLWETINGTGSSTRSFEAIKHDVVQQCTVKTGLIVFDNLTTLPACSYAIAQLTQLELRCRVLITCREAKLHTNANIFEIKPLSNEASAQLLQQALPDAIRLKPDAQARLLKRAAGTPWLILHIATLVAADKSEKEITTLLDEGIAKTASEHMDDVWKSLLPAERDILLVFQLFSQDGVSIKQLALMTGLGLDLFEPLKKMGALGLFSIRPETQHLQLQPIANVFCRTLIDYDDRARSVLHSLCNKALAHWKTQLLQKQHSPSELSQHEHAALICSVRVALEHVAALPTTAHDNLIFIARNIYLFVHANGYAADWLPLVDQITTLFAASSTTNAIRLPSNLALIARAAGAIQKALSAHTSALDAATNELSKLSQDAAAEDQRVRLKLEVAQCHYNIAVCHELFGDFEAAHESGTHALLQFTDLQHVVGLAHCQNLFGLLHLASGQFEDAEAFLNDAAHNLAASRLFDEQARTCINLARVFAAQGQFAKAQRRFDKADKLLAKVPNRPIFLFGHLWQARMMLQRFQYHSAYETLSLLTESEFIKVNNPTQHAMYLGSLGEAAFKLGYSGQAELLLERSTNMFDQQLDAVELARVKLQLAQIRLSANDARTARNHLKSATTLLKSRTHNNAALELLQLAQQLKEQARSIS